METAPNGHCRLRRCGRWRRCCACWRCRCRCQRPVGWIIKVFGIHPVLAVVGTYKFVPMKLKHALSAKCHNAHPAVVLRFAHLAVRKNCIACGICELGFMDGLKNMRIILAFLVSCLVALLRAVEPVQLRACNTVHGCGLGVAVPTNLSKCEDQLFEQQCAR